MTKKLKLYRVLTNRISDEISLGSEGLSYTTGNAKNQIDALARTSGKTDVEIFNLMYEDGWSNGYVGIKKMDEPKPGAAGRITDAMTG
jgi:hypothetical protein